MHESPNPASSREERYSRQILFPRLGENGQARLRRSRILIVGCGALGSHAAEHLARAGVGTLLLVDRDIIEFSNLHRQATFTEADAREGKPKAIALAEHLGGINSDVSLDPRVTNFDFTNAARIAEGSDLILDGSDNVLTRFLINDLSLASKIPWVYGGAVGEIGHAQFFFPGHGPCLRCLLPDLPAPGELETCDTAGVIGPAPAAIASFQAAMGMRFLSGGAAELPSLTSKQVRIGLWSLSTTLSSVQPDPQCPACAGGRLDFLEGRAGEGAAVLCGRKAVQVLPASSPEEIDLDSLAGRLRSLGDVILMKYFLRFKTGEVTMTIFPDGRALIEGTTDPGRARALHARYVGH